MANESHGGCSFNSGRLVRNKLLRFITRGCAEATTAAAAAAATTQQQQQQQQQQHSSCNNSNNKRRLIKRLANFGNGDGCVMNYWTLLSAAVRRATKFVCHAASRTRRHIGCCRLPSAAACCMLHVAGDTRQRQQPQQFVSAVAACLRGTEFGQSQCQIWPGHSEYCESLAKSADNLAIFYPISILNFVT